MKQISNDTSEHRRDEAGEATLRTLAPVDALPLASIADIDSRATRNADMSWNRFSPDDYWLRNYHALQAEDQEIIRLVSQFFIGAFEGVPRVQRAIDVGSGPNLYPALLMLPWTEQVLLTDFSPSNVCWLERHLADEGAAWTWQPFWNELDKAEGYHQIGDPREHLRKACVSQQGSAGIEQLSVFELPTARWDLGTMFFVAECITEDPEEFRAAIAGFIGALKPGAPFAAAFMAGSDGYPVAGIHFPALPISQDDVRLCFAEHGSTKLNVEVLRTTHRVRDGYQGMIVATGLARDR
jgi:hypothetical protein